MLQLILWILVFYLGFKMIKSLASSSAKKKDEVMGKKKTGPLDLSKTEVQDAKFEDIDENKNDNQS